MPEEVIGNALIAIQPDFSRFEEELTRGLQEAIQKAQKQASVQLRTTESQRAAKQMEQSVTATAGASEELNRTLSNMDRSLRNLNRTMKESRSQGAGFLATVSQMVNILAGAANAARGVQAGFEFFGKLKDNLDPAQLSLFKTATGFDRIKAVAAGVAKSIRDVGSAMAADINMNNRIATGSKEVAKGFDQVGKKAFGAQRATRGLTLSIQDSQGALRDLKSGAGQLSLFSDTGGIRKTEQMFKGLRLAIENLGLRMRGLGVHSAQTAQNMAQAAAASTGVSNIFNNSAGATGNLDGAIAGLSGSLSGLKGQGQGIIATFSYLATGLANVGRVPESLTTLQSVFKKQKISADGLQGSLFGAAQGLGSLKEEAKAATGPLFDVSGRVGVFQESLLETRSVTSAFKAALGGITSASKVTGGAAADLGETLVGGVAAGAKEAGNAAGTLGGRFAGLVSKLNPIKTGTAEVTKETSRLNGTLNGLADRIDKSNKGLGRFDVGFKVAKKAFQTLAVGTVKNADEIVASSFRVNKALGGFFGGPKFAFEVGSTIGLVTTLVGVLGAGSAAIIGLAQKASTAEESMNALNVLLGDAGPQFKEMVGNTTDLGLSGNQLRQAISPIVPLMKDAGLGGEELASGLNDLTRRAVDLSSIFNVSVQESLTAMGAAIRGEVEPIRRLGVTFNAVDIEAKAASLGFQKVSGEFTESAKQLARYHVILEKSKDVEGDFAATSTGVANAQRVLGAKLDNIAGIMSKAFYPAAQKLVAVFIQLADKYTPMLQKVFEALAPLLVRFADLVGNLSAVGQGTAQVWGNLLIPILQNLTTMLNVLSPVLTAFLTQFLTIKSISLTLRTFAGILGVLPENINGASRAVGALSNATGNLMRTFALVTLAMQMFGLESSKAGESVLTGFGQAFKYIGPLLTFFLSKAFLLKSIPAIVAGVSTALTTLSARLASTAIAARGLALLPTLLGGIIGPALAVGTVMQLVNARAIGASEGFEKLTKAAKEWKSESVIKEMTKQSESIFSFGDALKSLPNSILNVPAALVQAKETAKAISEGYLFGIGQMEQETENFKQILRERFAEGEEGKKLARQIVESFEREKPGSTVAKALREEYDKINFGDFGTGELVEQINYLEEDFGKLLQTASGLPHILAAINKEAANFNILNPDAIISGLEAVQPHFDKLRQEMLKPLDPFQAVFQSAKALKDARTQLTDLDKQDQQIRTQIADVDKQILDLETKRDELASSTVRQAEEEWEARHRLIDLERQLIDLQQEREELLREEQRRQEEFQPTLDDMADQQLSANINLERSKRRTLDAQKTMNDLLKEANEEEKVHVNLQGLTVGQIKDRLADVRATLAAQRATKKEKEDEVDPERKKVEAQEEYILAQISERDAERQIVDLAQQKDDFLYDQNIKQREYNEKIDVLRDTESKLNIEKQQALRDQKSLLDGEIGVRSEIRDIEKEVKGLEEEKKKFNEDQKKLAEDRKTLVSDIRTLEIEAQIAVATAKGDTGEILRLTGELYTKKASELGLEKDINAELDKRINKIKQQATETALLQDLLGQFEKLGYFSGDNAVLVTAERDPNSLINQILKLPLNDPRRDFLLNFLAQRFSGFAKGGVVNTETIARIGEGGRREAVLPLTRPARMTELLARPEVLNPILANLPKISLPAKAVATGIAEAAPALRPLRVARGGGKQATAQEKNRDRQAMAQALVAALRESGITDRSVEVHAPVTLQTPAVGDLQERSIVRKILKELKGRP